MLVKDWKLRQKNADLQGNVPYSPVKVRAIEVQGAMAAVVHLAHWQVNDAQHLASGKSYQAVLQAASCGM